MHETDSQRRAAYFVANYLPASQAFIYQELVNHERYDVDVFAMGSENRDRFPWPSVHTLLDPARPRRVRDWLAAGRYAYLGKSGRFDRLLRQKTYAVAHAQFGPSAVYARQLCALRNIPMICTFGGVDVRALVTSMRFRPGNLGYWPYYLRASAMLRSLNRILTVSQGLADQLIGVGAEAEKVHVFYRGVHVPEELGRSPALREKRIVMAGRFVEKKGFTFGISAFERLSRRVPGWKLTIAGDGPLRDALQRQVRSAGLTDRVDFPGQLSQAQLFELMGDAAILLVPSVVAQNGDSEGIPNVIKEAGARGLPTVATTHAGIPEIVRHGDTGMLVPERSPADLAAALEHLCANDARRIDMAFRARKHVKSEFEMKMQMGVLEGHYDDVIAQHRACPPVR